MPRRRRRHFERARGFTSPTGRRSSGGYARFGATACAARIVFDELTLESFIWENTVRPAHAVAPNLAYPPGWRLPVRHSKPLARPECRRRKRGTPPRRDADCGSQWRFPRLRACARPRILGGVIIWLIDGLLTEELYRNLSMKARKRLTQYVRVYALRSSVSPANLGGEKLTNFLLARRGHQGG